MQIPQNLFMFSGQGSHYYMMGSELYEQDAIFRQTMKDLDSVAYHHLGISIINLLYHQDKQKNDLFDQTRFTNPAIFMVEYALAKTLLERGVRASSVLGVSLGVYAAACVAGAIGPEDALTLVIKQGLVLEQYCPKGTMVAVLASPTVWEEHSLLQQNSEIAAVNAQNHFVISAPRDKLSLILQFLNEKKITHQTLAVSHAFHSKWIDLAQDAWLAVFENVIIRPPRLTFICSALQGNITALTPETLWNIMRRPIYLSRTIQYLERDGPYHYIDVGPAGTLNTLLKYTIPAESKSISHSIMSPFPGEYKKFLQLLNKPISSKF